MRFLFGFLILLSAGAASANSCNQLLEKNATLEQKIQEVYSRISAINQEHQRVHQEVSRREESSSTILGGLFDFLFKDPRYRSLSTKELEGLEEETRSKLKSVKKELVALLPEIESKFPAATNHLEDSLNSAWITTLPRKQLVALWPGSDRSSLRTLRSTIKSWRKMNYTVVVDAHSPLTPELLRDMDESVVTLGAHPIEGVDSEKQIIIRSPFLRWQTHMNAEYSFGAKDSPITAASILEGHPVNVFTLHEEKNVMSDLELWQERLNKIERKLGLKEYKKSGTWATDDLAKALNPMEKNKKWKRFELKNVSADLLVKILDRAVQTARGEPIAATSPVVIFGSGKMEKESAPLVYSVAYELAQKGYGITTGGSGGAMLAANMGAFDAGGVSIGIPIQRDGEVKLELEKIIHHEVHTETIEAPNYGVRIPLLMHNKQLFLIAPGGSGTIREIAATLIHFHQGLPQDAVLVLLQTSYYDELMQWLVNLGLPENLRSRLFLVNDEKELYELIQGLQKQGHLQMPALPVAAPRIERKDLPKAVFDSKN